MTTSPAVRVRIAPSPTGYFHVGGARTALFNWAFALQQGGTFVLRVEDTDTSRNRPEWTEGIISALGVLGMTEDTYEGPYFQSANVAEHTAAAERLKAAGKAYYCGCTRDEIVARTGDPHRGYDGHCRDLGLPPGDGRALRFRTPDSGQTTVIDVLRGEPTFENALIEDFVIARADGSPVFLLANVVDDMLQRISHVIRGEEHLSNAPKQQLLWEALGGTPPIWAHVPVIVNEKRQKLSKRRDKVALEDYLDEGYLPLAIRNYLMLLGWAPRDGREIVPWDEMVAEFALEDVNLSSAFFDVAKLRAVNGDYIRAMDEQEFATAALAWLEGPGVPWKSEAFDLERWRELAGLAQTRLAVMSEVVPLVDFVFLDEPPNDPAAWAKAMKDGSDDLLAAVHAAYSEVSWEAAELKAALERVGAERGLKLGKAQAPVRVAVTGRTVGLPLFEPMELLGRAKVLSRIEAARERLAAQAG